MKNLLIVIAYLLPLTAIGQSTNYEAQYRVLVDKFLEVYSTDNLNLVDEIYAPDALRHSNTERFKGRDEIKKNVKNTRDAFPDLKVTLEKAIYTPDKVVFHWIASGKLKASGETLVVDGVAIFTVAGNQVIDHWGIADFMTGYRKLGYQMVKQ